MKIDESLVFALAISAMYAATASAQAPKSIGADDRTAIQTLVSAYAQTLAECRAEDYAALFVPETGYFASGFRGHFEGREALIKLVESERQCLAPADSDRAARPGRPAGPTVELEIDASGVHGVAKLGQAEYQDEYTKSAEGWKFASRSVIVAAEQAAGLDAHDLLAIHRLGGSDLGDHYVPDDNGIPRLLNSGVSVSISGDEIRGRAYLKSGGYRDEIYERLGPGEWQVKSSTYVAP